MYKKLKEELQKKQSTWLITGVAGFIGSNLLEKGSHMKCEIKA